MSERVRRRMFWQLIALTWLCLALGAIEAALACACVAGVVHGAR